jgi:hypothetical protein
MPHSAAHKDIGLAVVEPVNCSEALVAGLAGKHYIDFFLQIPRQDAGEALCVINPWHKYKELLSDVHADLSFGCLDHPSDHRWFVVGHGWYKVAFSIQQWTSPHGEWS